MENVTTLTGWQLLLAIIAIWIFLVACICVCAFKIESIWESCRQGFDPDLSIVLFHGHLNGMLSGGPGGGGGVESATMITQRDASSSTEATTAGPGDSSSLTEIQIQS